MLTADPLTAATRLTLRPQMQINLAVKYVIDAEVLRRICILVVVNNYRARAAVFSYLTCITVRISRRGDHSGTITDCWERSLPGGRVGAGDVESTCGALVLAVHCDLYGNDGSASVGRVAIMTPHNYNQPRGVYKNIWSRCRHS